jgi:hypothetical protein
VLNAIEFLGYISQNLEKAVNFIYLQIDLYSFETAENLIAAPDRGVSVRVMKTHAVHGQEIAFNPVHLRAQGGEAPLVEVRKGVIDGPYLYVSDAGCAVAFKTGSEFVTRVSHPMTWTRSSGARAYSSTTGKHCHTLLPARKKIPRITTCRYRGHTSGPTKNIFFLI